MGFREFGGERLSGITHSLIREATADNAEQFARRVYVLGAAYVVLFTASLVGIGLLVQWARTLVTLTQRSNVETLTLLFFLVFYGYSALISARGAWGALRIAYYAVRSAMQDVGTVEQVKAKALGPRSRRPQSVALSLMLTKDGAGSEPFELAVADDYGSMGRLRVDGVRLTFFQEHADGSTELFVYFEHQVADLVAGQPGAEDLAIVEWETIDDESLLEYLGLVRFARNLERALAIEETWPALRLTEADCRELEQRLSRICRDLRNEGFLPKWEYSGDHKLPLIPEPLGLLSLGRSERRVDPVFSMLTAATVVLFSVFVFSVLILVPPWVPGK